MRIRVQIFKAILASAGIVAAAGQSNIDPAHAVSDSDWIGKFNWLPSSTNGASINQYYCSGFLYGAEIGWINLGDGEPADRLRYKNDSASDFGVNVMPDGALRGFAYGANIGWIAFSDAGAPSVDWNTGKLSGKIWSANAGWINLASGEQFVRIASIPPMADSDGDDLPDAWEIQRAGNLAVLSAEGDADADNQSDLDEYLAGTNSRDETDFLGPVQLMISFDSGVQTVRWPTKSGYLYRLEVRTSFDPLSQWIAVSNEPIPGTGEIASIELAADSSAHLFYRVKAFPPLTSNIE